MSIPSQNTANIDYTGNNSYYAGLAHPGSTPGTFITPKERAALMSQMKAKAYDQLASGAYVGLGCFPAGLVLANIGGRPKEELAQTKFLVKEFKASKFKMVFSSSIKAPIVEEIIFRGFLLKGVKKGQEFLGFDPNSTQSQLIRGGVVTTAFAAVHMDPKAGMQSSLASSTGEAIKRSALQVIKSNRHILTVTGMIGAVCHYQAEKDQSLIAPMATHAVYNSIMTVLLMASFRK